MGSKPRKRTLHGKILTPRYRKKGQPPGTIEAPPDALPTNIRAIGYGHDSVTEKNIRSLSEIHEIRRSSKVLWLNIDGLRDHKTLAELGDIFGLHALALEDVMNIHQRPKAEDYDTFGFVVVRMPERTAHMQFEQVSMFFGKDYVITIQETPGDCFDSLRQRIRSARGRVRQEGADYLAYAVIDTIIDQYGPVVERYTWMLESLEERILTKTEFDSVTEVHAIRHDLHTLRTILVHTGDAVAILARNETGIMSPTTSVFLRDCHDHTTQLLDGADACRSLSSDLLSLYASMTAYRMNEIMKVLTIIATIFIPLSFIAGLYGMNFDRTSSPWNMPELEWTFGYPFALGIMAATAAALLVYFRKKGWILTNRSTTNNSAIGEPKREHERN